MKFSLSFKFVVGCSLILLSALSATFYVINERQERLILRQAEREARAIFQQIVIMRKWVADHGGIFVEKLPWIRPTPYVAEPEIVDEQGRSFVRETPAMVTKDLAAYARQEGLYWFHITSLHLTNPENAPDDFERRALLAFENEGLGEYITMETIEDNPYLRYISPLYVEDACLKCHVDQGYVVGDVRGAISVTLPLGETFAEAAMNKRGMFIAMLLVVAVLSSAMIYMMRRLVLQPMKTLSTSMNRFSEGSYDSSMVLRTGDEFEDLSRVFSEMAMHLTQYHEGLQGKIRIATSDLADTNRKLLTANELLSASNERKSDFIARAAHELRTPLTSIKGSMEYVTARLSLLSPAAADDCRRDELLEFFELIRKNTDRLIRMVNTMIDIERIEMEDDSGLQFTEFDLAPVLSESVAGVAFAAAHGRVRVTACVPEKLPVRADEDRIRQVLANLLGNALKFAPADSQITVRGAVERGFAVVRVEDQGPGIPPEEREKVFDKFYKLGAREGSGLGLAICRTIIEAHHGTIAVSESEDGGACVRFTLPVAVGR